MGLIDLIGLAKDKLYNKNSIYYWVFQSTESLIGDAPLFLVNIKGSIFDYNTHREGLGWVGTYLKKRKGFI